jgi:hypothetical protein
MSKKANIRPYVKILSDQNQAPQTFELARALRKCQTKLGGSGGEIVNMLNRAADGGTKPSARLSQLLSTEVLPLVGVFGGIAHHAQLAEGAGFPFFGVSGAHTSMHILGMPDAGCRLPDFD